MRFFTWSMDDRLDDKQQVEAYTTRERHDLSWMQSEKASAELWALAPPVEVVTYLQRDLKRAIINGTLQKELAAVEAVCPGVCNQWSRVKFKSTLEYSNQGNMFHLLSSILPESVSIVTFILPGVSAMFPTVVDELSGWPYELCTLICTYLGQELVLPLIDKKLFLSSSNKTAEYVIGGFARIRFIDTGRGRRTIANYVVGGKPLQSMPAIRPFLDVAPLTVLPNVVAFFLLDIIQKLITKNLIPGASLGNLKSAVEPLILQGACR